MKGRRAVVLFSVAHVIHGAAVCAGNEIDSISYHLRLVALLFSYLEEKKIK